MQRPWLEGAHWWIWDYQSRGVGKSYPQSLEEYGPPFRPNPWLNATCSCNSPTYQIENPLCLPTRSFAGILLTSHTYNVYTPWACCHLLCDAPCAARNATTHVLDVAHNSLLGVLLKLWYPPEICAATLCPTRPMITTHRPTTHLQASRSFLWHQFCKAAMLLGTARR